MSEQSKVIATKLAELLSSAATLAATLANADVQDQHDLQDSPDVIAPVIPAYVDLAGAALHLGVSTATIRRAVQAGALRRGVALTRNGKKLFKIADLDAGFDRAFRSRQKPLLRGMAKQHVERRLRRKDHDA